MLTGIGCAAKVRLQLLKGYEDLPERYKKPYKSRVMKKETGHQSRYALYQNWCPVMVRGRGLEPPWCYHTHLKRARLPIPPPSHVKRPNSIGNRKTYSSTTVAAKSRLL